MEHLFAKHFYHFRCSGEYLPHYYPHYSHPQPDYLSSFLPQPELRRSTSQADYSRRYTGNRRQKYYPATFSHAPLELRPVRLKKSLRREKENRRKREHIKMCTWSPYTSTMCYSDPTKGSEYGIF